jgi:hypothetical protein
MQIVEPESRERNPHLFIEQRLRPFNMCVCYYYCRSCPQASGKILKKSICI